MWIRTQDKEKLMDCTAVGIGLEDDKSIFSGGYVLGTYSSKEKAMKVLDKIEKVLIKGALIEQVDTYKYLNHKNFVFQMPLDCDII